MSKESLKAMPVAAIADRIVREPERRQITGRSTVSWWRDEQRGDAPRRVRIGPNSVGWRLSELLAWIESRESVCVEKAKSVAPGARRGRKPKTDFGISEG